MDDTLPTLVYLYGRNSAAHEKSINDQLAVGEADINTHPGWVHAGTYSDSISASRFSGKIRDDWARLLADLKDPRNVGQKLVWLWESSRGDRTPATWIAFLDLCRDHGIAIHIHADHTTYDLTNWRHYRNLADDGLDNAGEVHKTSVRVKRGTASSAAAGRPSGGRCPYGYRRVYDPRTGALAGQEPNPATAGIIREIIERVARRDPVSAIANDLNHRDIPRASGAPTWHRKRILDIVNNPVYIGRRRHNDTTYDGTWPPLVDTVTWYAAQRVLSDPARSTTRPGRQKHLLSYLATSVPCGAPMGWMKGRYRCTRDGCVTISAEDADRFVEGIVFGALERADTYEALRQAGEDADREVVQARELAATKQKELDTWRLSAAQGKTSPESLAVIEAALTKEIKAAQARERRAAVPPLLREFAEPGADVRARWAASPMPARRELVRMLIPAGVRIAPAAVPRSRRFESDRVLTD